MAEGPSQRPAEDTLEELRGRYDDATAEWQDVREEARKDLRYVAGDPWEPADREARKGRRTLAFDELGQYHNQTINDVRANPRSVKFSPRGNGADDDGAEWYSDKMREVEYRSKASLHYISALENSVQRSYGFVGLITDYASPHAFDLDVWVRGFPNPELVTPDPYAQRPDGLDQEFCFVEEWIPWGQFKREHPGAQVKDFKGWTAEEGPSSWAKEHRVKRAEYWTIERGARDLLAIDPGDGRIVSVFADDPKKPRGIVKGSRTVDFPYVCQYLTNGLELLKKAGQKEARIPWPGQHIPIAWCLGKVLWLEGKRIVLSQTRLARDPYKAYCYQRCAEVELTAATPIFPYFAYRGSLTDEELKKLTESNRVPQSVIIVEPTSDSAPGTLLPAPQRNPYDAAAIQSLEISAESFRRAIQAAMGVSPLPTMAQKRNEKSGKALQQMEAASQKGSFHFIDAYNTMIEAVGVLFEEIAQSVYDTARQVGVRKADDPADMVWINTPEGVSTQGDYLPVVSTGPHYDTERERASDFVDNFIGAVPEVLKIGGDLLIKLKSLGPIGDQLAERFKTLLPPEIRQAEEQQQGGGEMDPQRAMQELGAARQQIAQMQGMLQQAQMEIKSGAYKEQVKAQANERLQIQLKEMDNKIRLAVAQITAGAKLTAEEMAAATEADKMTVEVNESERDRVHEMALAEQEHAHKIEEGDRAFRQGMVQGDVQHGHEAQMAERGHRQKLEQGDQAVRGQLEVVKAKPQPVKPKENSTK